MSTKERYGTIVWDAVCHLARNYGPVMSIGEVAATAKVSYPTAKKYLEALVTLGHVDLYVLSHGMRVYTANEQHCLERAS
jgi:hypothetical protein